MSIADAPMPGAVSGTLPTDTEHDPAAEEGVEGNAQPEPDSSLPPVEDDL